MISFLRLTCGFTVAAAGAAVLTFLPGLTPQAYASCAGGEEEDTYTTTCTPFLVPNSPSPFQAIPGNPDIPAIDGIPCTGRNAGQCIGLAEDAEAEGPQAVPRSTVGSSPTVHGSTD